MAHCPFDQGKFRRVWLKHSGGAMPEDLEPEEHERVVQAVTRELCAYEDDVREEASNWGGGYRSEVG